MHQSKSSVDSTLISDFYKRYPYPKVDRVEYDFNLLDHFHYLAGLCPIYHLAQKSPQRRGRMLIAGCGTREAVMWAFSLPHFDIDAIDISENSLEISRHLAQQLELTNINFIHGNFERGQGINGTYDFVHSFGVLHHLESPEKGLAYLEKALRPNGLMSIMVYNDANRRSLQRAQRCIQLLTQHTEKNNQEGLAHALVKRGAKTANRLQTVFQKALDDIEENPQQFADTMLNPREVSYTIPSLIKFLQTSHLEIVSPALPTHWKAQSHLTQEQQILFSKLSLIEQMEICDHLDGPLFWVLVQRSSERSLPRPCSIQADLFWSIVPLPLMTGAFPVEKLQMKVPYELKVSVEKVDETSVLIGRGYGGRSVEYHKIAYTMIEQIDGHRTLREIALAACKKEEVNFEHVKQSLMEILHELIDVLGLATPDFHRCTQCPSRCSN